MKRLIQIVLAIFFVISFSSCKVTHNPKEETPPPSSVIPVDPGAVATYTCDDLKAINQILFITFAYDTKYDLDNDGAVTVQDKLIIERDLLKYNSACVTALRTCDNLQAVKDEVQLFTDLVNTPIVISAIAATIIFNESGQRCVNDFSAGSFIGDVNKNGYLDCNDPLYIKKYTVGLPLDVFEPALADVNASGGLFSINATDALYVQLALNSLFNNYMPGLACPQQ
ncbi:MAG: hypothetical protein WCQ47_07025 [bacterium]